MKYTVNSTCGHSREVELFGQQKVRDNKLAWMRSTICWNCEKAKREREAQANSDLRKLQLA